MKTVPLHGKKAAGRVALVDDEDYELVSQYRWIIYERTRPGHRANGPYVIANAYRNGRRTTIKMHGLITGQAGSDHADHNGLNNQRSNLRPATTFQNRANQRPRSDSASRFKGVFRVREGRRRRWGAHIKVAGTTRILGYHDDEEAAAHAYDTAALAAWGEFAYLNFPPEG